ncbi:hypothetical protein JCM5350_001110, partial [Sporobolomyces pararoseus]
MKVYTKEQVEQHKAIDQGGIWLIVDNKVYDLSSFVDEHPGGKKVLLNSAGTDASSKFWQFHNEAILERVGSKYLIGTIGGEGDGTSSTVKKKAEEEKVQTEEKEEEEEVDDTYFGDLIPFGDPAWYQDWSSPYYKPSHYKVRRAIREFTDTYLTPNAYEWDQKKEIPPEEYKRIADHGILCAI